MKPLKMAMAIVNVENSPGITCKALINFSSFDLSFYNKERGEKEEKKIGFL